jgi:hypothetical protein
MKLGLTSQYRVGYALGDEKLDKEDGQYSLAYAIAWRPDISLKNSEYYLPGEKRGDYIEFGFRFDGLLFVFEGEGTAIRLSIQPPVLLQDVRGLPFLEALPYVGSRLDVLEFYGEADVNAFVPLMPLDLMEMDRLYLERGVTFVGVTASFGRHKR